MEDLNAIIKAQKDNRKLRLFAVACCYEIIHLMKDDRSIHAVKVAELYADGLVTRKQLLDARDAANDAATYAAINPATYYAATYYAANAAYYAAANAAYAANAATYAAINAAHAAAAVTINAAHAAAAVTANAANAAVLDAHAAYNMAQDAARAVQLEMAKDIFGPDKIPPLPRTNIVMSVAEAVYLDKSFGELPVLADALEDAGCEDAEVLDHLRSGQRHWRGCWVLDSCTKYHLRSET